MILLPLAFDLKPPGSLLERGGFFCYLHSNAFHLYCNAAEENTQSAFLYETHFVLSQRGKATPQPQADISQADIQKRCLTMRSRHLFQTSGHIFYAV